MVFKTPQAGPLDNGTVASLLVRTRIQEEKTVAHLTVSVALVLPESRGSVGVY